MRHHRTPVWTRLTRALRQQGLALLLAPPALLAVAFDTWDFASIWVEHDRAVEDSILQNQGIAREVAHSYTSTLQAVEVEATDHLTPMAARFIEGKAKMPQLLAADRLAKQRLPQLHRIHIYDSSGRLVASPHLARHIRPDIHAQPFFQRHADNAVEQSAFVAALDDPGPDSPSAKWQLHLAQSIHGGGGEFIGLVVASLDTEHLFGVIGEIPLATGTSVRVFDGDGRLLLNHPRDFTQIGKAFGDTRLFQEWTRTRANLAGRLPDPTDNSPEIGVFRKVDRYPVLISVGIAEDLALAEWWKELTILLLAILALVGASLWSARRPLAGWVLHLRRRADPHSGFRDGDGI